MVDAPLMAEAPRQAPAASVFDRLGPQGSLGRAESSGTSAAAQQADDDDSNAALKVSTIAVSTTAMHTLCCCIPQADVNNTADEAHKGQNTSFCSFDNPGIDRRELLWH